MYHKHVHNTWYYTGSSLWLTHSDTDRLPDNEENTPTPDNGVVFPVSDPNDPDSHELSLMRGGSGYASYADEEVRCRIVETNDPKTFYPDKDWSACSDNLKW